MFLEKYKKGEKMKEIRAPSQTNEANLKLKKGGDLKWKKSKCFLEMITMKMFRLHQEQVFYVGIGAIRVFCVQAEVVVTNNEKRRKLTWKKLKL